MPGTGKKSGSVKGPAKRPRIGAVLSSGGVRGVYAHTGFLLALQRFGIDLSALAGCSAGAVVGGIAASGQPIEDWAEALAKVKPGQFWNPSWPGLLWSLLVRQGRGCTGLSSTAPARKFCLEQLRVRTFEECSIPFHALAVHIATGNKTIFETGELVSAMLASAAIPMLYEPVGIGGEWYCDGALLDLAPTDAICCQHQLDILIIHHVAQRQEGKRALLRAMQQPWTMIEILNMLLYQRRPWYLSDKTLSFRHCPCGCGAVIVILEPTLPELVWPVTASGPDVLTSAQEQALEYLQTCLPGFRGEQEFDAALFDDTPAPRHTTGCQSQ